MKGILAIMMFVSENPGLAAAPLPAVLRYFIEPEMNVRPIMLRHGQIRWENVRIGGGMLLRVTAGDTVIEAKRLFFGDGKVVIAVEAGMDGMHFLRTEGFGGPSSIRGKVFGKMRTVIDGVYIAEPGAFWVLQPDFLTSQELDAWSVYLITPSIRFEQHRREALTSKP